MRRLLVAPRDGEPQAAKFAGGHRIRVTPVPIPNTEVKPDTADGTAWETVWESRSLPALFLEPAVRNHCGLFFFGSALRRHTVSHARMGAVPSSRSLGSRRCGRVGRCRHYSSSPL